MTDTVKKFLQAAMPMAMPNRELVVVPPTSPSAQELLTGAQSDHEDAERAAQTSVEKAIAAGKKLRAAKKQTPHGSFEEAVAAHCKFTMGTAQKYMRLAKREAKFFELIEQKRSVGLHLSMREALTFLNKLTADEKPKPIKRKQV
jgi:hypothetical protein